MARTWITKVIFFLKLVSYHASTIANPAKYGTLTTQQLTKLKQLTIISLSEHSKLIPYATLISELDLPAQQGGYFLSSH